MTKQIVVWIIDDDELSREQHRELFSEFRPDVKVVGFECLFDTYQCRSSVDYIFIDLSAVDVRTIPSFDNHSYIGCLRDFVERHCSAFICIMSALISHAIEDVEDIKEMCPDVMLFSLDSCDIKQPNVLVDFVNKYSPL